MKLDDRSKSFIIGVGPNAFGILGFAVLMGTGHEVWGFVLVGVVVLYDIVMAVLAPR